MFSLGSRGFALIQSYEAYRSEAYLPTPDDVPTIGWGHTRGVRMGDRCTEEQAEIWLREDARVAVETVTAVALRTPGKRVTQAMFDALVSLVFNVGARAVTGVPSTIGNALILGDWFAAWAGFALWRKQAGKDLLGIVLRGLVLLDHLPPLPCRRCL